ncbi:MAG: polysaccharide biosynthesis protein [Candidatus Cloacimonadota bacterium]|nr:MAG: polysaccharide biosynthesis protein [Candidatus Cloacimonadota bacterium]
MKISRIKSKLLSFSDNQRSRKILANILLSFGVKGGSIVIGFLMVPLCLDYLDSVRYGIWVTMSSFLSWFTFFEIGLGSGLRNKLSESLALKDYEKGKIYVSTTYGILSLVVAGMAFLFAFINPFLNWVKIINTDAYLRSELNALALIVFNFFFLRFILKLISVVLYADQKPAFANAIGPIGNFLSIAVIFILTKTTQGSLIYLGLTLSIAPVLVMLVASIVLFCGKYKNIAPSIKFVRFKYAKDLLSLGIKFFIIQVSALVLFQTSNIIIAQFFGPAQVTPYTVAHKLFSTMNMIFAIVMMPFWSAFTDAWTVKDIQWIRKSVSKLLKFWVLVFIFGLTVLILSPFIFKVWVGEKVKISFLLSTLLFIYFSLFTFGGIFNMFINGVGKIKLQLVSLLAGSLIFFPLSYIFIKYLNFGIEGLVLATIIANIYLPVIAPVQYYKIINNKASGIWNK